MRSLRKELLSNLLIGLILALSFQAVTEKTQKQEPPKNCPRDTICVYGDKAELMGWPLISYGKQTSYRLGGASGTKFSSVISFNEVDSIKAEFTEINNYPEQVYFYLGFLINVSFFSLLAYAVTKFVKKIRR